MKVKAQTKVKTKLKKSRKVKSKIKITKSLSLLGQMNSLKIINKKMSSQIFKE